MLDFGSTMEIQLAVLTRSIVTKRLELSGYTKAGYFEFRPLTTNDGFASEEDFRIDDIPISVALEDFSTDILPGQVHAQIFLLFNGESVATLSQGPVSRGFGLSWPHGPHIPPLNLIGLDRVIVEAQPANNTEHSIAPVASSMWRIKSLSFELVTDATGANRRVHLRLRDGVGEIAGDWPADFQQVASTTRRYTFAPQGITTVNIDNDVLVGIPTGLVISDVDGLLETVTENLQATDRFSAAHILVEEVVNPAS